MKRKSSSQLRVVVRTRAAERKAHLASNFPRSNPPFVKAALTSSTGHTLSFATGSNPVPEQLQQGKPSISSVLVRILLLRP